MEYNGLFSRWELLLLRLLTYLLFGVAVAADGPQVFQSSPQEDDEETPEESDHGGGEESPPHPLAVAVTGHICRKRDDHVHLGNVDRRVRVEFIPIFRHFGFFLLLLLLLLPGSWAVANLHPQGIKSAGIQALGGAPASAP